MDGTDDKTVGSVRLEISSPEQQIRGISSVQVYIPSTTVVLERNHTLHDVRMGAFRNVRCGTCGSGDRDCPGHMGHIALRLPVVNPMLIPVLLARILRLFCMGCLHARPCSCPDKKELRIVKGQPGSNTGFRISFRWTHSGQAATIRELHELISSIPESQFRPLFPQFKHLKNLGEAAFIHNVMVVPISARPPTSVGGQWVPNSLTVLYGNVLSADKKLRLKIGIIDSGMLEEFHATVQNAVNVLLDVNNTSSHMNSAVTDAGGIRQRIDGKQGRVRLNLMGKRVNFSARTVLSGDPQLGINEIGVPASVADNLTIPTRVGFHNLHAITSFNIKYVIKGGVTYDASIACPTIEVGDIVERSLRNGDVVAVNRQPTLHRGSMVACAIRIFQADTFRLNYSTMITLNADTDGDEINIHVPQDLQSQAELRELMPASTHIVSSQSSRPLMGLTQDSLLGMYLLSKETLQWEDYESILYNAGMDALCGTEVREEGPVPGWAILEAALRHMDVAPTLYKQGGLEMRNGKVVGNKGLLDKSVLGASDNSIFHIVYLTHGHLKAASLMHHLQRAATHFLDIRGFSVGVGDCVVEHEPIDADGLDRFMTNQPSPPEEGKLCEALNGLTQLEMPPPPPHGNSLHDMIASGAKGKVTNFNQITRLVGQQFESTGRIQPRMRGYRRTLPHFPDDDFKLGARGFIRRSFIQGLRPEEFFMQAIPSRISLVDTACKTSVTGAQQRRLVKTLENISVQVGPDRERLVVDGASGRIIQFNYGDDGMDALHLKKRRKYANT